MMTFWITDNEDKINDDDEDNEDNADAMMEKMMTMLMI